MTRAFQMIAAAAMTAAILASPARAHSVLERSDPAADATVPAPERLELTFSETIGLRFSTLSLTDPDGAEIETDGPELSDDGHSLILPLSQPLTAGDYQVRWGVLSQDGHKVDGEYGFTVE